MLVTDRLELLEVRREHKDAFQQGRDTLGRLLEVTVPANWPEFPEALLPSTNDPGLTGVDGASTWPGYLFVDRSRRALVGNGGYAGDPNDAGEVEIGYEVAPAHRNLGYASEAVRALLAHAISRPEITAVIAHTLAHENASVRVLRKCGMKLVGQEQSDEVGVIWRWRLGREEWSPE